MPQLERRLWLKLGVLIIGLLLGSLPPLNTLAVGPVARVQLAPGISPGASGHPQVSGGGYSSCALLTDGTLRCWGRNGNGELGDGTTTNRTNPVSVSAIAGVQMVAGGSNHTCAVLAAGTVRC